MICFIIPLKSKQVSNNWETVSKLFEHSLQAAYSQTYPDFKIICVCHELPILKHQYDDRVEFLIANFLPPNLEKLEKLDRSNACMRDKWNKVALAMVRAGEIKPNFVMIMDADDRVSNNLAKFVHSHPESNGWILKQGYNYQLNKSYIYFNDKFNCGTNAIVNTKLIQFPKDTSPEEKYKCILLQYGHTIIESSLAKLGTPLTPLPFPGAVYIYSHGDNDSDFYTTNKLILNPRYWLGKLLRLRLLTKKHKEEFYLV